MTGHKQRFRPFLVCFGLCLFFSNCEIQGFEKASLSICQYYRVIDDGIENSVPCSNGYLKCIMYQTMFLKISVTNCAVAQLITVAARLQVRLGRGVDSRPADPLIVVSR